MRLNPAVLKTSLWMSIVLLSALGCKGTGSTTPAGEGGNPETAIVIPDAPSGNQITGPRADFYKQAFPQATAFESRDIPEAMVRALDKGNTTYIVAKDAQGETLGYLRDISAPMTLNDDCPCNPLSVTLAFQTDLMLLKLLGAAPLQKAYHQPMSESEMEQLTKIVMNPPESLLQVTDPKLLVDGASGATRKQYQGSVILEGAYTTWRVSGLVRETQRILAGAPISRDSKRLEAVLTSQKTPEGQALALAAFIPTAESEPFAQQAMRTMVRAYVGHLDEGGKALEPVEARILDPKLSAELSTIETLYACQGFSSENLRPELQKQCLTKLETATGIEQFTVEMGLLRGNVAFHNKDYAGAAQHLSVAGSAIDPFLDPGMHIRLVTSLKEMGQKEQACMGAQGLYMIHPTHTELPALLTACGPDTAKLTAALDGKRKEMMLASKLSGTPVSPLNVTLENRDVKLNLATGKASLVVFFATWCPHCQDEMPHLVDFQTKLQNNPALKDKVQLLGVRTAIEREQEPYMAFQKRFKVNFPIYTDPAMSLVFQKFMQEQNKKPGLPTLVVVDGKGIVRYFIENGEYRNLEEELMWALESLL